MKKEKNYLKTALIIVSVITVILAIVLVLKIKELSNVNQRNKELSNELQQLKDGVISMNNNSDENKKQEYDGFDGRADYDPETDELSQEYWLDTYEYLIGKFLQGIFAAIYTYTALHYITFLNLDLEPVFSPESNLSKINSPNISPVFYIACFILLCSFIYIYKLQKQKKTYSH